MKKMQQLEMFYSLWWSMTDVPNDLRSQNYTKYLNEVKFSIQDLVEELNLDPKNWGLSLSDKPARVAV